MRPSWLVPSVLRTVGRCVAMSPSLPIVTSTANGRDRISACASPMSSTLNCAGVYMLSSSSSAFPLAGRGNSCRGLDALEGSLQLGDHRLELGLALAVLLDHLGRRLGEETLVGEL